MASKDRQPFDNPVVEWFDSRLPIFTIMNKEYGTFPTPKNFNYFWNFGAIAMVMLITMIVTGIFLAMQYTAHEDMAFDSVQRIMRDVNWGWLLRYIHMNGASFFFIAVYIHIFRGMYYGSYKKPRELLWILGVAIFLLMMATAFMGYTLPWSQMSGWGATVITNLFSAIPVVGKPIVEFLWGGFSVDNPTLKRFFALHYLLPFVIVGVVFLHVWALHVTGSNNPTGIEPQTEKDTIPFHPFYTIKDTFGLMVFLLLFVLVTFYKPEIFAHSDHFVEYNPLQTPHHIVPEWYFLPFYAILRAITFDIGIPFTDVVFIEAKLGGVLAMFGAVGLLFVMPWLDFSPVRSARYRPAFKKFLLFLVFGFFVLMYVGAETADALLGPSLESKIPFLGFVNHIPVVKDIPMGYVGLAFTAYHFFFFLVVLPYLSKYEKTKPLPKSINEAVLEKNKSGA